MFDTIERYTIERYWVTIVVSRRIRCTTGHLDPPEARTKPGKWSKTSVKSKILLNIKESFHCSNRYRVVHGIKKRISEQSGVKSAAMGVPSIR
jgi:hypothetical protein